MIYILIVMKIHNFYSPNFEKKKRSAKSIKMIIIHYTGMQSERESIVRLCNPKSKVSSHFLIGQNGKVYQLVKNYQTAWHAGKSCWGKYKNLNKNSIGIELVNKGHSLGYEKFKKKQLLSLEKICKILIKKYKVKKQNIIGHSDIAPSRKIDPGEKFPWSYLSSKGVGIYPKRNLTTFRFKKNGEEKKFIKNLHKIGYRYLNTGFKKNRYI